MAWTNIFPIVPPPAGQKNNYTKAIVQNKLYIFQQGLTGLVYIDLTVPGVVTPTLQVPTFINMSGLQGIVAARGRIAYWDDANAIGWGDIDNLTDFQPSLETRANTVKVDSLKGNIVHCEFTDDGFIVYTTSNIVQARFTPNNAQNIFSFDEIGENIGIFSKNQVSRGEEGTQYAFTNTGLVQVKTTSTLTSSTSVKPIAPDISDYITSFEQPPRLSYHLDRFLVISLPTEQVNFARTVRMRNYLDAITYFRDRSPFNNFLLRPDLFASRALVDDGLDFSDGAPISCEPSVPPACNTHVLWGMPTVQFPQLELEATSWTALDLVTSLSSTDDQLPDSIKTVPVQGSGDDAELNLEPTTQPFYTFSTKTFDDWKGQFGLKTVTRYAFDPLPLLMYQAYIWQADDAANFLEAAKFKDVTFTLKTMQHAVSNAASDIIVVSDTGPVIDPNVTKDDITTSYVGTRTESNGIIRFTNQRTITTDVLSAGTRQIKVEQYWKEYLKDPDTINVGIEGTPGILDGTIQSTTSADFDIVPDTGTMGLPYLVPTVGDFWDNDTIFKTQFLADLDRTDIRQVNSMAPVVPVTGLEELWSTARTIVAQTDRCTYANIRSFLKNRAVSDDAVNLRKHVEVTDRYKFKGLDGSGNSLYYLERTSVYDINYGAALESLHNDLLTLPGPDIPLMREVEPVPLATITGKGNPSTVLEEYYQVSVATGVDLIEVYRDRGWTVAGPPPATPFSKAVPQVATPPVGDIVNGTDPSTLFDDFYSSQTICGEAPVFRVVPYDIPEPVPVDSPRAPDIVLPETIVLDQEGVPGALFPTYQRGLIFDRQLKKWGTANLPYKIFFDISPINEVVYDPSVGTATTRFTFDNFLRRLGALLDNGMVTLFDDSPDDSYIVFGKIGFRRRGTTRIQEVMAKFAENPNAFIILESSIDGRTINPYTIASTTALEAVSTLYPDVDANWFNIVIRGRFHLTQLEFEGSQPTRKR